MSAFVSSNDIEASKRQQKKKRRELREAILKDAKEDFERKKKLEERKRRLGEDEWIASGVSERLGLERDTKQRKKSKKGHKKSKSKHSRKASSSDDSTEEMWVEKSAEVNMEDRTHHSTTVQRDEWMTKPLMSSVLLKSSTRAERKKKDVVEEKQDAKFLSFDKPGQHPLELNPFWKEGGSGLPQEQQHSTSRVNDGGRSWILRSYKRALEQAESEGKSLEEIATVRWGSLAKLHSLLHSAGIDPENPDGKRKREYLHSSVSIPSKRRNIGEPEHPTKRSLTVKSFDDQLSKQSGVFLKPGEASNTIEETSTSGSHYHKHASYRNWQVKNPKEETRTPSFKEDLTASNSEVGHDSQAEQVLIDKQVTDSQLNSIAAKIMKAELVGDETKVRRLNAELETLRKLKESQDQSRTNSHSDSQKKTIVLATTDRFGRVKPFKSQESCSLKSLSSAPSGYSKKGKQKRVYDNEDGISLKSMMEEERRMTAEDTHAAIARMASKFVPAANSEETVDDVLDSKKAARYDPAKEEKSQRDRAVFDSRKMTEILESCRYCFGNHNFEKHLLIAVGIGVYLAVPGYQSLTEGHCLLVPMEHTTCSLQLDENVWSEVQIFQKGLTRMFSDLDMDVIFTEICMSATKKSHMYIECIPMPKEEGSLAPMYFKKAIQESDTEWSENKKLIDTRQKGIRNSIPVGLPYFYVNFGLDGGYAHIIEDQTKFPRYFAKEVVGGMLDVEPRLWLKPPKESFESQKRKVNKLSEWWKPYDWTQKLKTS